MKKFSGFLQISLSLCILLTGSCGLFKSQAEKRVDRQVERIKKSLSLTKDQSKSLKQIILQSSRQMSELRKSMVDDRQGMRQRMEAINEERDFQIKDILTAQQWEQYQNLRKEMRKQMGERRRQRPKGQN